MSALPDAREIQPPAIPPPPPPLPKAQAAMEAPAAPQSEAKAALSTRACGSSTGSKQRRTATRVSARQSRDKQAATLSRRQAEPWRRVSKNLPRICLRTGEITKHSRITSNARIFRFVESPIRLDPLARRKRRNDRAFYRRGKDLGFTNEPVPGRLACGRGGFRHGLLARGPQWRDCANHGRRALGARRAAGAGRWN